MTYAKPTLTLNSTNGRYSAGTTGVCYTLTGSDGYYIYAKNPNTGVYWRKDERASTSGVNIYLGANATTSDQYYTQVILSSEDLGETTNFGSDAVSSLCGVVVPYIVSKIYNASSTVGIYNSADHKITDWEKDGYELNGWTNHPTVTNALCTDWDVRMDGKTFYTVWYKEATTESKTCFYHCGTYDEKSVSVTLTTDGQYIYGQGATKGGDITASVGKMETTCAKDATYGLDGWSSNTSLKTVEYKTADLAFAAGKDRIYGIYSKQESMKYYPQNGELPGEVPVTNYIYGVTRQTNDYPSAPQLEYEGYTLKGWANLSSGSPLSWKAQWNAGERIVYAIWVREGNVYYCPVDSNDWLQATVYYGYDNGTSVEWVPVQVKCEDNLTWK